jgi:alpha-glucosidase
LPGALYLYQGDELGLDEVDVPPEEIQDPMHARSGGVDPGRDGCRVPLPWSGDARPFGFSPDGATTRPWLTQPAHWAELTVERQAADPASMLRLYREALRVRRAETGLRDEPLMWAASEPDVLAFSRGDRFLCVTNLSSDPLPLPPRTAVLLASADVLDGHLPSDATAWLRPVHQAEDPAWRLPTEE